MHSNISSSPEVSCRTQLFLLGAGHAYPETVVSNTFLAELSAALPATLIDTLTTVQARSSVLSPLYLRETKNSNAALAQQNSSESPTTLGVRAAQKAFERAGITADKIGMVLAESSTPEQTIPSAAQRIAKQLGLKVPSFDIAASTASTHMALHALGTYQPEKLPEYILIVSTNALSQRINYTQGLERILFGDGAGAVVVSPTVSSPRKIAVAKPLTPFMQETGVRIDAPLFEISLYKHLSIIQDLPKVVAAIDKSYLSRALQGFERSVKSVRWIPSHLGTALLRSELARFGLSEEQLWCVDEHRGCMLGASFGATLSERWERIAAGDTIISTAVSATGSGASVIVEG